MFFLIYVDDIILIGSDSIALHIVFHSLSLTFPLKDLGPLCFFLGLEIQYLATGLHLSHNKYICNLLKKTHMEAAKPVTSPMSALAKVSISNGLTFDNLNLY